MAANSTVADDTVRGPRLHVPPECWCVTRQDLRDLRREVQQAVRERRVVPTARDPFDPADNAIGPNFYTVVEQYIKAETAESRASWALQRHPEGLRCDLFITHAWAEGIYEFIDKVLASWPRGTKHAWICTLSMPQHLNIAELIRSPRESPFAKALESATHVLAVPNQVHSIYTRLWCVYEAFLAQEQGKIIHTAVRPHVHSTIRMLVWVVLGIMVGLVVGFATSPEHRNVNVEVVIWMLAFGVALFLNMGVKDSSLRGFVNTSGGALTSFLLIGTGRWNLDVSTNLRIGAVCAASIVYFISAEIDRGRLAAYEDEKSNLERDFEGSVLAAKCTDPADKAAIWVDIGDAAEEIDSVILVLMKARMSTPLWSRLASAGINIQDVAIMEWSFLILGVGLLLIKVSGASRSPKFLAHLAVIMLWLVVFGLLRRDRRRFALRAIEKIVCVKWITSVVLVLFNLGADDVANSGRIAESGIFIMDSVVLCVGLLVSATPPLLLARIPCVGRLLVQLVLLRPRLRLFEGRSLHLCLTCAPRGRRLKRPASAGSESPA